MLLLGAEEQGTTGEFILGLAIIIYMLATVVSIPVSVMKGKLAAAAAGFLLSALLGGLISIIAAFKLAKPNSFWARRFYGPEKLRRSRERYGEAALPPQTAEPPPTDAEGTPVPAGGGWECRICGEPYPSKGAALAHARSVHRGVNPETSVGESVA